MAQKFTNLGFINRCFQSPLVNANLDKVIRSIGLVFDEVFKVELAEEAIPVDVPCLDEGISLGP